MEMVNSNNQKLGKGMHSHNLKGWVEGSKSHSSLGKTSRSRYVLFRCVCVCVCIVRP